MPERSSTERSTRSGRADDGLVASITGGIVAGYDGSRAGVRVVEWAWAQARARHRPLHVVRAWTLADVAPEAGAPFGVVPSLAECEAALRTETRTLLARLAAATDATSGTAPAPAVEAVPHVVHGPAGDVLAVAAEHADLVVVGHRGRGRLSLVLGSVTEQVLAHARCPVVVVPLTDRAG